MKLRHLKIERFRGIKNLDWHLLGDFMCLIGPGDMCKSTILDAIELVLSPKWNPSFDDADFHDGDASQPIVVEATVGELPRRLLSDTHFGLRLRGYSAEGSVIHDEPDEGDEEVITIRLQVDESLEPEWYVVTARHADHVRISARERERLGVMRLGAVVDRHLTWTRGSALSRLTGDVDEHARILADAGRNARSTITPDMMPRMADAAKRASDMASRFGVRPRTEYRPSIDPMESLGRGGVALHDGAIPVRLAGLGTRRLVTLSVQRSLAMDGGVVLIDEVAHALEPYRVRRLMTELLEPSSATTSSGGGAPHPPRPGVVIVTTHSPIAVGQLRVEHLRIVRTDANGTRVLAPSEDIQGSIITHAEAFLSKKVIVCEGATELGLLLGLDAGWSKSSDPMAVRGVALTDAKGADQVAGVALDFRKMEYETAVLADSDVPLKRTPAELAASGVLPILWEGAVSTEQRLFHDLPWEGVSALVAQAIEHGYAVQQQLATALGRSTAHLSDDVTTWLTSETESDLRAALGVAAKAKKGAWFKNVRYGKAVGEIVATYLDDIKGSDLETKVRRLREWILA